jgi:hypothetical protein
MSRVIDVYDNVMEPHEAELIDAKMKKVHWQYEHWQSDRNKEGYHWNRFAGTTVEEIAGGEFDFVLSIWETAKHKYDFAKKYNVSEFRRIYMNAHTFGIEPNIHYDDGDFTMIYYPRMDWDTSWGGGTTIYEEDGGKHLETHDYATDKLIDCRGNRLLVFDAYLPHQGMPVIRDCHKLRTNIVFKVLCTAGGRGRLDFYKK